RPPEPHVSGPTGSGEWPALLAPESDGGEARPGRSPRRRVGRHREVLPGLPRVARDDAAGARPRQPSTPALARALVQAAPRRLSTGGSVRYLAVVAILVLTAVTIVSADDDFRRLLIEAEMTPVATGVPPPLTLPDLTGKPVSLASFKDQAVLVYFWATW